MTIKVGITEPNLIINSIRGVHTEKTMKIPLEVAILTQGDHENYNTSIFSNKPFWSIYDNVIDRLDVGLLSDGDKYLLGGRVESKYLFLPRDVKLLGKYILPNDLDVEGFKLGYGFFRPSLFKEHDRDIAQGYRKYIAGFNMNPKMFHSDPKMKGNFRDIHQNDEESNEMIIEDLIRLAKLMGAAINSIYDSQKIVQGERMEDVQICTRRFYKNGMHQILDFEGEEKVATEYKIDDCNGIPIYKFNFNDDDPEIEHDWEDIMRKINNSD